MRVLFDTNILIDYIAGKSQAKKEIEQHPNSFISVISWIEVLVGAEDPGEEAALSEFLSRFRIQQLTQSVAARAVEIRRERNIRLPDAIIWASALDQECLLVTRNSKDFPSKDASIRIPYRL